MCDVCSLGYRRFKLVVQWALPKQVGASNDPHHRYCIDYFMMQGFSFNFENSFNLDYENGGKKFSRYTFTLQEMLIIVSKK